MRPPAGSDCITLPDAVEVRDVDGAQPRIVIRAIAEGELRRDRRETFDSLPRQPHNGVLIGRGHPARKAPIMRARLEVRDGALVLDAPAPDTTAGRDAIAEIRAGLLTDASVEFRCFADRIRAGVRHVTDSMVQAVALIPTGEAAYPGSTAEVRRRSPEYFRRFV